MSVQSSQRTKTILLVEDQALIAMAEKLTLERSGYSVLLAYSGEQALELVAATDDLDLVLMDINLGAGIDGTAAAERILRDRDVPIVFLSSHTEPAVVEKTEGITSYGYIVKNAGDTVLLAAIRMAFRLYEAKRDVTVRNQMLATMLEVSRSLSATLDLQTILQTASDSLTRLTGMNAAAIYLLDGDDTITLRATTPALPNDFPDEFREATLLDHPHIGAAIRTGAPVHIDDVASDTLTAAEEEVARIRSLRSILYVPLVSRERTIGAFITGSQVQTLPISDGVIDLCVTLANIAAVAAENAMLLQSH